MKAINETSIPGMDVWLLQVECWVLYSGLSLCMTLVKEKAERKKKNLPKPKLMEQVSQWQMTIPINAMKNQFIMQLSSRKCGSSLLRDPSVQQ